jgi:hypothetical protein
MLNSIVKKGTRLVLASISETSVSSLRVEENLHDTNIMKLMQKHRNSIKIVTSLILVLQNFVSGAHGTNPASAAMCGMDVKWIDDSNGMDLDQLETLCAEHAGR